MEEAQEEGSQLRQIGAATCPKHFGLGRKTIYDAGQHLGEVAPSEPWAVERCGVRYVYMTGFDVTSRDRSPRARFFWAPADMPFPRYRLGPADLGAPPDVFWCLKNKIRLHDGCRPRNPACGTVGIRSARLRHCGYPPQSPHPRQTIRWPVHPCTRP